MLHAFQEAAKNIWFPNSIWFLKTSLLNIRQSAILLKELAGIAVLWECTIIIVAILILITYSANI